VKASVRERTFTWSDPRELAKNMAAHGGLDWLREMQEGGLPAPPILQALDIQMESVDDHRVVFSMVAQEWMCNPAAVIHGGMVSTLLDTVLTLAVVAKLPHGKMCQTVQLSVNFVRPLFPTGERIVAEGFAAHVGTTVGTSEGRAYNAAGKLVAHATAVLAIVDSAATATRFPKAP